MSSASEVTAFGGVLGADLLDLGHLLLEQPFGVRELVAHHAEHPAVAPDVGADDALRVERSEPAGGAGADVGAVGRELLVAETRHDLGVRFWPLLPPSPRSVHGPSTRPSRTGGW
jgi:hypothetical protein